MKFAKRPVKIVLSLTPIIYCIFILGATQVRGKFLRFCYFNYAAKNRKSPMARHDIKDIDPFLCSHLVYAWAGIDRVRKALVAAEPQLEEYSSRQDGRYKQFNDLKKKNRNLKTLLAIGGELSGAAAFTAIAQDEATAASFAAKAATFLQMRDFDGLDINWLSPSSKAKALLDRLLKALHEAFNGKGLKLTLLGKPDKATIDGAYNVTAIAMYVDFVLLMTYDYQKPEKPVASFNSPLFAPDDPVTRSVSWTVLYWMKKGFPASKLIMGVTGCGFRYFLSNPAISAPGSKVKVLYEKGQIYHFKQKLAYPEICLMLNKNSTLRYFDIGQDVPYLVDGDNWVGYDNVKSVQKKTSLMMELGMAGTMFWSMDLDDFTGKACLQGKYPLLTAIKNVTSPAQYADDEDESAAFLRFCYFSSRAKRLSSPLAKHDIKDIDPNLCSHVIYASGKIDTVSYSLVAANPPEEESSPGRYRRYQEFNDMKLMNPGLKTLLSVGPGGFSTSLEFEILSRTESNIAKFAKQATQFLKRRNFDGLNVEWANPSRMARDKFGLVLKALSGALKKEGLLLTIVVAADGWILFPGYDVPSIETYVDYVLLRTFDYDLVGGRAGFNSPLFSRTDPDFLPSFSTRWAVNTWIKNGLQASKIVVGITGCGNVYTLVNEGVATPGSLVVRRAAPGPIFRFPYLLAYPEICQRLNKTSTKKFFDSQQNAPYLVDGETWVGYEDVRSVRDKVTWLMAKGVAGVMLWGMERDDFTGTACHQSKYPLLNAIQDAATRFERTGAGEGPLWAAASIAAPSPSHVIRGSVWVSSPYGLVVAMASVALVQATVLLA